MKKIKKNKMVDVLIGTFHGDEAKSKIVDYISPNYDIIARFSGGENSGHTICFDDKKYVLNLLPSGVFSPTTINLIGNGCVINPLSLKREIERLDVDITGRLLISRTAHLTLPTHVLLDEFQEEAKGKNKIGSTKRGIGPTYTDKIARIGLRIGDIESKDFRKKYTNLKISHCSILNINRNNVDDTEWLEATKWLMENTTFIDSTKYIQDTLKQGFRVLAEGAQGALLDIDAGTYPFVTSSSINIGGVCNGLGVCAQQINDVFGIFKAYTTRVGSGPFPTELFDKDGERMAKVGKEFGATTGRPRRCGWLDLVALKYAIEINGVTELSMMKSDVLCGFDKIKVCVGYKYNNEKIDYIPFDLSLAKPIYKTFNGWGDIKDNEYKNLPTNLKKYIEFIEEYVQIPIGIVSVGPDRTETIIK